MDDDAASRRVGPPIAGISVVDIDGRLSIFNPGTDRVLALNESASEIWRLCTGVHTAQQISLLLAERLDVDADDIRADVLSAVASFESEGLLATGDEGGEPR